MSRSSKTKNHISSMPFDASSSAIAATALMKLRGIGRRGVVKLLKAAPQEIGLSSLRDLAGTYLPKANPSHAEVLDAWYRSEAQLREGYEHGVVALSLTDEGYPDRLRRTPDPPAVLFVKGDLQALTMPHALAIVGTREPTDYGVKVARRSGETAAKAGFVVVSGLALGCDTHGHEGTLDGNGLGIAVLAHGLDRVYPAANRDLAKRLIDTGGCLVAEHPFGTAPVRTAFAERDRIQSGLSDGVLVIETDVRGGTMHTVGFSRDQHRILACIDHPAKWLSEDKTKGNQKLIADRWAVPIGDGEALLHLLNDLKARVAGEAPEWRPPEQTSMGF